MRHLQLGALTAQKAQSSLQSNRKASPGEGQRHEGSARRGDMQFPLPIRPPLSCKGGDPVVGTGEAQGDEMGL